MASSDWKPSASDNTSIGGIFIGPEMARGDVDNALRQIMSDVVNYGGQISTFTQTGVGAEASTVDRELRRWVWAEHFGLSTSKTPEENSAAIMAAIVALRGPATTLSTDGLNGGPFTAYASGELLIGAGVFPIAPEVIQIAQDLGLVIKGRGSRKTNNSVIGRTVLLITGTSSGFGIQVRGNGARGLVMEDLDLCYATSAFTGDCLDNYGAPGMVVNRCHIGTHGITGGTRLQTAQSCVRTTYDEFVHFIDTTFDGAVDGWWSDDARNPTSGTNEFGGAQTSFESCVFYDFTGTMMKDSGTRNRKGLTLSRCSFNPIAVNCTRALDLENIDGLVIVGCNFAASVSNYASSEWVNINNSTGHVRGCWFGDLSPVGTFHGNLDISNNFFGGSTGLTLTGGVITGSGNEFSPGTAGSPTGVTVTPTIPLSFRIGPDTFKSGMGRSYDIAADSSFLDGHIIYAATQDAATNKFRNVSSRVTIRNNDEKTFSVTATTYTPGKEDTGRTVYADGTADQTFTLPAIGQPGLKYRFVRNNTSYAMTVQSPTASTLFVGGGGGKTSITFPAGDIGSVVQVESLSTAGWNVTTVVGSYTTA